MKTHTPGPWQIEKTSDHSAAYRVMDAQEVTVALCYQQPFDDEWSARENARLISAAPDLLSELKMCVEYYGAMAVMDESQTDAHDRIMLNALAAIHKAEKGNA